MFINNIEIENVYCNYIVLKLYVFMMVSSLDDCVERLIDGFIGVELVFKLNIWKVFFLCF